MAEVAIPRQMFQGFCGWSPNYERSHHLRPHEASMVMRFKGARREECVQMQTARSAARQPFKLPMVTAAARATRPSCQNVGNAQEFALP
jgi:hypothetical protein